MTHMKTWQTNLSPNETCPLTSQIKVRGNWKTHTPKTVKRFFGFFQTMINDLYQIIVHLNTLTNSLKIFPDQTGTLEHSLSACEHGRLYLPCQRIHVIKQPQSYYKPLEQSKSKVILQTECMNLPFTKL